MIGENTQEKTMTEDQSGNVKRLDSAATYRNAFRTEQVYIRPGQFYNVQSERHTKPATQ